MLCAGLLFLFGAGCALKIGNTQIEANVKVDEQAVNATLESAAENIKQELQRRGLQVTVSPEVDVIRVVSTTKSGDKFTIVLNRVRLSEGKEQTRVRVEWDKAPDRELWLGLLVSAAANLPARR
jgi:hypothetical protein